MFGLDANGLGIALLITGAALFGLAVLLLRFLPKNRPANSRPLTAAVRPEIAAHADATLTIQPGGRILEINDQARTLFGLTDLEMPGLESIASRIRPADTFLGLCTAEGRARFVVEGRAVEGSSFVFSLAAEPIVLVTLRPVDIGPGLAEDSGLSSQVLHTFANLTKDIGNANLEIKPVILAVLKNIGQLFPADFIQFTIFDDANQLLIPYRIEHLANGEAGLKESAERFRPGEGLPGYLSRENAPILIHDLGERVELHALSVQLADIRSLMGTALLLENDLVGTLAVGSFATGSYRAEDLDLLNLICGQAALAIRDIRLSRLERSRSAELSNLAHLAQAFNPTHDSQDIYSGLLKSISPLLQVKILGFLIYNETNRTLEGQAPFQGLPAQVLSMYRAEILPGSAMERVFLEQDVLISEDACEDQRWSAIGLDPLAQGAILRDTVLIPLPVGRHSLGYLQASNHTDGSTVFTQDELNLLMIVANQAGPLIDNIRLAQQSRQRSLRAETLRSISRITSTSAPFDDILRGCVQELARLLHASVGAVTLIDENHENLQTHAPACYGFSADALPTGSWLSTGDPQFPFTAAGKLQPVYWNLLPEDKTVLPYYRGLADVLHVEALLAVPLVVRDGGIGEILFGRAAASAFDNNDLQTLITAASQIAGVVDRSLLISQTDESLRRRVDQLTTLTRISQELSTSLDLKYLLQIVLNEVIRITQSTCGTVLVFQANPRESTPKIQYSAGEQHAADLTPLEISAVENGGEWKITHFSQDSFPPPHGEVRSALLVPLHFQQETAGLVHLHSLEASHYDEAAAEVVRALLTQAAVALENALRYQEQIQHSDLLNSQVQTFEKLFEASQALRPGETLENALAIIAGAITTATPFTVVGISVLQPQDGTLRRVASMGLSAEEWQVFKGQSQPWRNVAELMRPEFGLGGCYFIPFDQKPAILENAPILSVLPVTPPQGADSWHAEDLLLVPLLDRDHEPLGLISVDAPRSGRRPDRTAIQSLEIFGAQACLAIENHFRLNQMALQTQEIRANEKRLQAAMLASQKHLPALLQKDLEQTLALQRLGKQTQRIRDGLEIAVVASRQADAHEVFTQVARELLNRINLDVVLVARAVSGSPRLVESVGSLPPNVNPETFLGQRNPIRTAFQDGELILVDNLDASPEWQNVPLLYSLEARSFICLPLVLDRKVEAAFLGVARSPMPQFNQEDRQIFLQLSRQVAITLQNLDLLNETRRRLEEMDLLLDFSRRLGSLDPREILSTLVESAVRAISAGQAGMAGLWDAAASQLRPYAAAGFPNNASMLEIVFQVDNPLQPLPLVLQACQDGKIYRVDEINFAQNYNLAPADLLLYRRASGGRVPVSSLLVPIQAGEHTLGLLVLDHFSVAQAFSEEDETLAASLTRQTGLALENARLFQASEQRARQMQSLTQAAGAIAASLQSAELISILLDQMRRVVPYDAGTLWLRKGTNLEVASAVGFEESENLIGLSVAVSDSLLFGDMIRTGLPLSVGDVRSDPRFPSLVELERRSWLGVPLVSKNELVGLIALEKTEADFYNPDHIQALQAFASQAIIGMENAQLYEESVRRAAELDQRSRRLALLNRLSSDLGSTLDPDTILRMTVDQLGDALKAARVAAVVLDENQRVSLCVEIPGIEAYYPQTLPYAPLFDHLAESQGIFSTEEIAAEPELAPLKEYFRLRDTRAMMAVPLVTGGNLHGVLFVHSNTPYRFSPAEIELAVTVGNATAIALQNAHLTRNLERIVIDRTAELSREHLNTETLLRVITELSASLDMNQVMSRTLGVLDESVGAEQAAIFMARPDQIEVFFRTDGPPPDLAHTGYLNADLAQTGFLPSLESISPVLGQPAMAQFEQDISSVVLRNRQSVLVPDLAQDTRWALPTNHRLPYRSVLAVPLIIGEEALGVLTLFSSQPRIFASSQVNLVEAAARQISVALNNSELFSLIRDQAEHLGNMLRDQQVDASRSRAILEAVGDGVLVTDAANQITLFNASAEGILGLQSDQAIGQSLDQFAVLFGRPARTWTATIRSWSHDPGSYTSGMIYTDQVTLENEKIVDINLAPVFLRSQFLGTVSIFRDITNEVRLDRLKSEFVANVSHELRTPLTSIKGYVEILLMGAAGPVTEQQRKFLDVVRGNTRRLNVLVNDLLDVSRIEAGKVTLTIRKINLGEIARDVLADMQRRAQEEGKPMAFQLDCPVQPEAQDGDPDRVRQVLLNLVTNAYNYTPPEGHVTVRIRTSADETQVDVQDDGIGIRLADQGRIFERFYRGEDPLVLATAGNGLGLAMARNLVEMHHGRIWFTSAGEAGRGSTFSFTLPLHQQDSGLLE